jgi:hypothetical protein
MRHLILIVLLFCAIHSATAAPSRIWWPGWTISSSEELWQGINYSRNKWTPNYPLTRLFDGKPSTAWVFSSTAKEWDKWSFRSRYGITLKPDKSVVVDGLRLMNGQNESRERFERNHRVTQIRVTMNTTRGKAEKTFSLPDRMGWHTVALPSLRVKSLRIEFTRLKAGKGPAADLCISELQLLHRAKPINLTKPQAVMFHDGQEGCSGSALITGNGTILDTIANDMGHDDQWSPNGRYVRGFSYGGENEESHLWIADAWQGKIIRKIVHDELDGQWKNNTLHVVSTDPEDKPFKQTIKLP